MPIRNRNLMFLALLIGLLMTSFVACSQQATISDAVRTRNNKELTVFAGAASKPPLDAAAAAYTQKTGIKVFITYGGSGSVLSQMKLSRTGDIYIPGSPDFMVRAEEDGQVIAGTSKIIAYLVPSINVPTGNPRNILTLMDLARPDIKIAIGNPVSVCVGTYAIELLDYNYLLEKVHPQIVTHADSCDRVATLIALKSVDAVMGWDVFHSWNPDLIDTIYLQPAQLPRLAYIPAALSTYTRDKETAQNFIDFLASAEGNTIFRKWGYHVTEADVRQYAPQAKIGGEYPLPRAYQELRP